MEKFRIAFNNYLDKQDMARDPNGLYGPVEYIMNLGGKRFRPILCLLGYSLYDPDFKEALPQAMALELFHNFTLMHDDIMDEAPLRRGQASVHEKWNTNTAILSGDAALIMSYDFLLRGLNPALINIIMSCFNRMALDVCEGQQLDMEFEERREVNVGDYLTMIQGKTSVLLGFAIQLGALHGGASLEEADMLRSYGINLGLSFQIQDDILDLYGHSGVGKKRGGDVMQAKKTILYAIMLERADSADRSSFIDFYAGSTSSEKVDRTIEYFEKYDVLSAAKKLQQKFYENAIVSLHDLRISSERKDELVDFGARLYQRST